MTLNEIRWAAHWADPNKWFWKRTDQSGGPDACWPYLGAKLESGYGRLRMHGVYTFAHRMALALSQGIEIPDRKTFACHKCDNPPCCNPSHLFWGTGSDNMQDAFRKGRRKGPNKPKIYITKALAMRNDGVSCKEIAKTFNVNVTSVYRSLERAALRSKQANAPEEE